jgi:hypothetical protein
MLKKQKIYNKYFICFILSLLLLSGLIFLQNKPKVDDYSVEIDSPSEKIVQPLLKNQVINITGLIGTVTVKIQDRVVKVIASNCPDKICIKAGNISKPGPVIICSPNRVMVRILSRRIKPLVTY